MRMRRIILLLLASAAAAHGQPKPVEDLPGLFLDRSSAVRSTDPRLTEPRTATKSEGQGKRNTRSDDPAAQRRIVGIAKEQLARARSQASAGSATRLRLNLLAGVDMTAVIERTARTSRGYSLAGHIAGMEEVSNVVLVVNGAVVMGDVWTPKGHYTIRTAGGGSYLIEKTDPTKRKPLAEPILPPRVKDGAPGAKRRSKDGPQATGEGGEDDGSTIDIFVFWTQGARLDAGGLREMQALVDLAIGVANEVYSAGDIQTRLNLVGATEVHYDYEGADQSKARKYISHLEAADDGYMTEVHDVRDAYSSDLVHLFFGPGETDDHDGLAGLWGPFGISVTTRMDVPIHEIGHNMGLNHDAYQLVTNGRGEEFRRAIERGGYNEHIRLYGIGYVNQRAFDAGAEEERRWNTVMAYPTQCSDYGFGCEHLLRFSNPRQRWPDDNGDPMGIAEEDAGEDDWPADASRAVNENRVAMANWRQRSARCRFDLSEEVLEIPADGGSATIEVGTSGASCPWHAVTNDAFVDMAVEDDRVVVRARAHVGPDRWGVVSIAGRPVSLRQLGVDHGDSRSDATRVSLPSRAAGEIDPGDDEDYFRFEVAARGLVQAHTTGRLDTLGMLYDADGAEVATDDDGGEGTNFSIRRQLDAGAYYVRVSSWGAGTGAYALHLSGEHGDSRSDATRVSLPSRTAGEISPGDDEDYFRFEVAARGQVRAHTTGRLYTLGALYDADGRHVDVATDDDGRVGNNFRIRRQLDAGAYYVRVSSAAGRTGTYALHLSGYDDHGDLRSNATRVSLPSRTSGEIDPGVDEDYFRFEMSSRGEVLVRTTGGLDTLGALYNADGRQVAIDDDGGYDGGEGTNFRIERQLDAGAYYVRVSSYESQTGAYALHLSFESASGGYRRTLGDFDGDGRDDMLLRHEDGRWFFYPMNGRRHMAGQGTANLTRNLAWSVAGVGDFDGDGNDDVLLRKPTTGIWYYYPMNGRRHLTGHGAADLPSDLSWSVAGIGDLDGDGKDDVLLRHANGHWHYYPMDGRRHLSGHGAANLPSDLSWWVAGIGDFDGDGKDGVLLRKAATTGAWYYYPMNGRRHLTGHGAANLPSDLSWSVAGIGDFDGDGKDDVLLRHADGYWHYYPMDGRTVLPGAGSASLTGNPTVSVAGIGDLNGDGRDDVLVRRANGTWYYYPMDGRRSLAGRGAANLTSNLAWGGLFPIGGTSGGTPGAPTVAMAIADWYLATGRDATLDLVDHFSDDQALVYEVRSSDAEVLRVSATGGVLTLMPVAEGSATVTVTARDPDGNTATQTFSVRVGSSGGGGAQVGERFRDCAECPEMVVVPAGTFMMGAPESEVGSRDRERPVHAVSVPSFAVGVYEVTFEEWDACVADGGCGGHRPDDEGWGRGRRPINVQWDDMQRYVEWLSSRTGERYRLPSESEWEYAARAGTTTPFYTGETITTDHANYNGMYSYPDLIAFDPNGLFRRQKVPAGSFGANAFGLHDVHGNVSEWVQDCWNSDYEGAPTDGSAWLSGDCGRRVLRGGSWASRPSDIRAAHRFGLASGDRNISLGFRVARTLTP